MTTFPVEVDDKLVKCALHRAHNPQPIYVELHHLVPRAWQKFWWPKNANVVVEHDTVWNRVTIPICRTGHGNVHRWLGAFMRQYEQFVGDEDEDFLIPSVVKTVKKDKRLNEHWYVTRTEANIAIEGMYEWVRLGGSLKNLCKAKHYGDMFGVDA